MHHPAKTNQKARCWVAEVVDVSTMARITPQTPRAASGQMRGPIAPSGGRRHCSGRSLRAILRRAFDLDMTYFNLANN